MSERKEKTVEKQEPTYTPSRKVRIWYIICVICIAAAITLNFLFPDSEYVTVAETVLIILMIVSLMGGVIGMAIECEDRENYELAIKQQKQLEELERRKKHEEYVRRQLENRKRQEEDALRELKWRKGLQEDTSFDDILKLYGLEKKDNVSEIIKILKKDYFIVRTTDDDWPETASGWFDLCDKKNCFTVFAFSDICAAARGDRDEYDDICDFDSFEYNMAGLAAWLLSIRANTSPLFTSVQQKLRSTENDAEKQAIIQEAFHTQDWKNIVLTSPNNKITVRLTASYDSKYSCERISVILGDKKLSLNSSAHYPHIYEKMAKVADEVLRSFSFIELCVPEAPPEVILGIIGIIENGKFYSKSLCAIEDEM